MLVKHGKLLLIFDRVTEESLGREAGKINARGRVSFPPIGRNAEISIVEQRGYSFV